MENINLATSILSAVFAVVVSILSTIIYVTKKMALLDTLESDTKELKKDTKRMSDDLIRLQTRMDIYLPLERSNPLAKSHSPISLTDEGVKIKNLLKADSLIQKHAEHLYEFVDKTKTNNAYDIQLEAFRVVASQFYHMLSASETIDVKNVAYSQGKTLEDFLIIFQILFRDYMLKKHGMVATDVDKHNPQTPSH